MRRLAVALLATVAASTAQADEARVLLPTQLAARVRLGSSRGRVVQAEPRPPAVLVTVNQALHAFPVRPAFPIAGARGCRDPEALAVPAGLGLPREIGGLVAAAGSALDVLTGVVDFVSRRIVADELDGGPQDAISVLRRGRGRCSGRANLAVGLLRLLDIPARPISGLLLADDGPRWHRWGEAWLGRLGWVAFDPGASVGVVSVRHLPMEGAADGLSLAGIRVEHVDERGYARLPQVDELRVLPVGGTTLRCRAPDRDEVVRALLLGPAGDRWARQARGEVVFAGLLPGPYELRWLVPGRPADFLELQLNGDREVRVTRQGASQ